MVITAVEHPKGDESTPAEPTQPPRRRLPLPARSDLFAVGAYVLLGVFVCGHYWADVQHRVSSHLPTDHTWFEWLFTHGAYSVRHLENPLFSVRQNVPDGVNMMANTSMLGVTLPLAPVTMLLGAQVTYALYLGAALAATAAVSYWVLSRHLVTSRAAAFVAGAFLGFAPGIVHHANGQPNFASNFLLPLIVLRVLRLGTGTRWLRDGVILGLLVAYQVFINEEMLLLTALACLVIVIGYAAQRFAAARARAVRFLGSMAITAAVAGALVSYPLWFQFNGPQSYRGLENGVFHGWGEDLAAFVTFPRDTIAGSPAVEKTIGLTEQNTWFGWPLVVLIVLIVLLLGWRSVAARTSTLVGLLFAAASVGPQVRINTVDTGIPGPWAYLRDDLPLVEMMMPTRLNLVVVGAVGVLIALAWDRIATAPAPATVRTRVVRIVAYASIVLALLPLFPRPLPARHVDPPPKFITSGAWRPYVPDGRTLVPVPVPSNVHGLATLRWSVASGQEFPVPGGYFIGPNSEGKGVFGAPTRPTAMLGYRVMDSGNVPPIGEPERRQAIEDLRYWRASVVVLGHGPHEQDLLALMTELLGPPQQVDDVWLWDVRSVVS